MTIVQPQYLTLTGLKLRHGWSEALVKHFLGEPDTYGQNPHYRSAASTRLYLISRIEAAEQLAEWQQLTTTVARRKQTAAQATDTKRARIMQYVEHVVIKVPLMTRDKLTDLACAHYNARKAWRGYQRGYDDHVQPATAESDESFLIRISTNYLRHCCTRYETELKRIEGKVGVDAAYERLKERVNEVITNQYEFLKL